MWSISVSQGLAVGFSDGNGKPPHGPDPLRGPIRDMKLPRAMFVPAFGESRVTCGAATCGPSQRLAYCLLCPSLAHPTSEARLCWIMNSIQQISRPSNGRLIYVLRMAESAAILLDARQNRLFIRRVSH